MSALAAMLVNLGLRWELLIADDTGDTMERFDVFVSFALTRQE